MTAIFTIEQKPPLLAGPVVIELAGEPQGKGRHRFVRATGRTYTPSQTAKYEAQLRFAAGQAMKGRELLEGALAASVAAYVPIPGSWSKKRQLQAEIGEIRPTTKPDADNIIKMLDALNGIVFGDDKQIVKIIFAKHYSTRPCLWIEVWPIAGGT